MRYPLGLAIQGVAAQDSIPAVCLKNEALEFPCRTCGHEPDIYRDLEQLYRSEFVDPDPGVRKFTGRRLVGKKE